MEPLLTVEKLSKTFGKAKVVSHVTFSVAKGEIFALIGPNGAGKSTTLKMLATLLAPSSGSAKLGTLDVVRNAEELRKVISYLPEEAGAYKNMRGTSYLQFMADLFSSNKREAEIFYKRGVEVANLGDKLKQKVSTYSKGMTRKLLLARTVMSHPQLAILDEPTSGLDITNAVTIRKTIKDLASNGMTVLLSSHNMLEIAYLSDRVGLISNGKLHDVGTPQELMKRYDAQNLEEVFIAATKK
jgi:ABC-2 type transport system ATP-binding protein